ncbi:hypothetical protein C0989_006765 [Termitomyces sp. Mn162]|nr:hypothetical protein C0989_006765 [Termitomyces sp. Mn162]
MPHSSPWEEAWNAAQPRLSAIRDAFDATISPNPRVIRVGKLDSELLDQELVQALQEPIHKALSLINASLKVRFEPELTLLLQLILYKLSIWNNGASYGAKLQGLKYSVPPSPEKIFAPERLIQAADSGEDELGWTCLRCNAYVKSAERYIVEIGSDATGSDYEFTSISGSASIGSYSESGWSDSSAT